MPRHTRNVTIAALLTLASTMAFSPSAYAGDLFTIEQTLSPSAREYLAWTVRIDTAQLRTGNPITLPIPGAYLDATAERVERRDGDDLTWRGRTRAGGQVLLTTKGDAVYGLAYDGPDTYEIVPTAGGQVLRHVHEDTPCGTADAPSASAKAARAPIAEKSESAGTTELRALYLYTDAVELQAGGPDEVHAMVQGAVDQLNATFANSLMDIHTTLVGVRKVDFTETGDLTDDLTAIRNDPTAIALRTQYQANYVGLFVSQSDYWCGYSYVMREPGPDFAPNAFHVTWTECTYTDQHEVGHTLGFEHDPDTTSVSPSIASFPYSFGHRTESQYRTVMSYSCSSSPCFGIPYFSNPDITFDGWQTGLADQRDNARTGRQTAPIVAQFYYDPTTPLFQDGFEDGTLGSWSFVSE